MFFSEEMFEIQTKSDNQKKCFNMQTFNII